ncbi:sigma 54-interacting transcriptional regulator [bacterium]|nr:sigma 54-interacting transcriptional regulator [bacterium]
MSSRRWEELFRDGLNHVQDAVIFVDAHRRIVYLNQSGERLTGLPLDAARGKTCTDLLRDEDEPVSCDIDAILSGAEPRKAERTTLVRADGTRVPVEICIARAPHSPDAAPTFLVNIRDLSELGVDAGGGERVGLGNILSRSPLMARVFALIESIADIDVSVLIQGESGTGKELVALAIHERSLRKDGPFHAVNCGALTLELLDSELFGHEKGAFTGAIRQKPGRLEMAAGGTLFLDEVGDMPPALQVKLLRVLQERKFERVGGTQTLTMDARIIAATNVDLDLAVRTGRFRQDLFYRLNVVPMHLPPLRERPEDIELIAHHFLRRFSAKKGDGLRKRFSPDTKRILMGYAWPGNVRELINAIEYVVAVSPAEIIMPADLPDRVRHPRTLAPARAFTVPVPVPDENGGGDGRRSMLEQREAERILSALERHHYRRGEAASELGMSRTTLWRKMQKLGMA